MVDSQCAEMLLEALLDLLTDAIDEEELDEAV